MGIPDLAAFLKTVDKTIFVEREKCTLEGKRYAMDISIYLYRYISTAQHYESNWFDMIIKFILNILTNNIHLIVVFDGTAPIEKNETLEKRKNIKLDKNNQSQVIADLLKEPNLLKCIDRVSQALKRDIDPATSHESLYKECLVQYGKYNSQSIRITQEHVEALQSFLTLVGVPWFIATGEAERTCSWLSCHDYVDGVITEDIDVLCFGAKVMVKGFSNNNSLITVISRDHVLKSLAMTPTQFVDFCIMCGTDYNNRLPGIGPAKAFKLFSHGKTLDTITINTSLDLTPLNYIRVRELFSMTDENDIQQYINTDTYSGLEKNKNANEFQQVLDAQDSKISINWIRAKMPCSKFIIQKN